MTTSSTQPAATYARHTIDRLTEATRQPGQDATIWDLVHLLGVISALDVRGHGDAIRAAVDEQARTFGLPAQSEVEGA